MSVPFANLNFHGNGYLKKALKNQNNALIADVKKYHIKEKALFIQTWEMKMENENKYIIILNKKNLDSIGVNTKKDSVEVEVIIEDGILKIRRIPNDNWIRLVFVEWKHYYLLYINI